MNHDGNDMDLTKWEDLNSIYGSSTGKVMINLSNFGGIYPLGRKKPYLYKHAYYLA